MGRRPLSITVLGWPTLGLPLAQDEVGVSLKHKLLAQVVLGEV